MQFNSSRCTCLDKVITASLCVCICMFMWYCICGQTKMIIQKNTNHRVWQNAHLFSIFDSGTVYDSWAFIGIVIWNFCYKFFKKWCSTVARLNTIEKVLTIKRAYDDVRISHHQGTNNVTLNPKEWYKL